MKRALFIILAAILTVSMFAQSQQKVDRRRKAKKFEKGSLLNASIGVGAGSLGYKLSGVDFGKTMIQPSFTLQLNYSYFFTKNWGIGTGVHFTNYGQIAKLNGVYDFGFIEVPTSPEYHSTAVRFGNWKERQDLLQIEIPVLAQYKWKKRKEGLMASLGAKLGIPVYQQYKHTSGTVSHEAYFPYWNVTFADLEGHYQQEAELKQSGKLAGVSKINVLGYVELGWLHQLNPKTDLVLSVFGQFNFNSHRKNTNYSAFPYKFNEKQEGKGIDHFNENYEGLFASNAVGTTSRPWMVGVKVGINFFPQMTDAEKARRAKRALRKYKDYLPVTVLHDTITDIDTLFQEVVVHDTIHYCPELETHEMKKAVEVKRDLEEKLSESVIFFNLNEYVPILEPIYIIDSIAEKVKDNPNIQLHVNGHACTIGSDAYNVKLALKRAQAVANLLIKKGVPKNQIIVKSYGSSAPYRYNKQHQLEKERRVEIIPEIVLSQSR